MPLFRRIVPTPDTADATYDFDSNPDPAVWESVDQPTPEPAPAEEPTESETEDN